MDCDENCKECKVEKKLNCPLYRIFQNASEIQIFKMKLVQIEEMAFKGKLKNSFDIIDVLKSKLTKKEMFYLSYNNLENELERIANRLMEEKLRTSVMYG